ncbi:uncharacterized protein J3D65DRAFT_685071, partial [Phyllosticta citribraziliensis]
RSIISLHFARDRCLYTTHPPDGSANALSDDEWSRNRLLPLQAEDALSTAAAAMAGNSGFQNATKWHHEHPHPYTDPLKLGGIHRAQLWMKGANNHFFVAEWAQLRREDQLVAYQLLRNFRMEMLKVGATPQDTRIQWRGGTRGVGVNGVANSGVVLVRAVSCASIAAGVDAGLSQCAGGACVSAGANGNSLSCAAGFSVDVACGTGGLCDGASGGCGGNGGGDGWAACGGGAAGGSSDGGLGGGCGGGGC